MGSEEIPEITVQELELALSQMKNGRAPGKDGITTKMIKLGGNATIESMGILLNKCLTKGKIPRKIRFGRRIFEKFRTGQQQHRREQDGE